MLMEVAPMTLPTSRWGREYLGLGIFKTRVHLEHDTLVFVLRDTHLMGKAIGAILLALLLPLH